MKRLALAASIALAVSTIGVGPAAASTLTTYEASAAQEGAEAPSEDAADPGEADDSGADAADPGTGTTEAEGDSEAGQDDGDESSNPDAAEDGDTDGAEESEAIDAGFTLEQTEMTAEEIGDPNQGIRYTVDSLKAGDVVTGEPGENSSATIKNDGAFTGTILGNTELKTGDTLDITVTVEREGQESKTFSGSVKVVAPDGEDEVADLTVSPKTQKLDRFLTDGVQITLANCVMDEQVNFSVTRQGDSGTVLWEDTQWAAGEDSAGFTTFIPGAGGDSWIGDFVVTVSCGDRSAETTVTVTDSDGEDGEASNTDLTVTPKTQELQKFFKSGVSISLVNCVMDDDVNFRVGTKHDPDTTVWEETQKAGEDAAGHANFIPAGDGGPGWVGEYLVMVSCGDHSAETTFTVTADDSVVDPKLSVDPETISGEDFINRDKGVTMTVSDCTPGSDVRFGVFGQEPSENLYDRTVEANENGAASVQTYGLEDSPEAYVGGYNVVADCMGHSMKSEFVVTGSGAGDTDGGSGDSGNAGSMPRTGAELTGLGAGAVLILGGAATLIFARRRSQSGQ